MLYKGERYCYNVSDVRCSTMASVTVTVLVTWGALQGWVLVMWGALKVSRQLWQEVLYTGDYWWHRVFDTKVSLCDARSVDNRLAVVTWGANTKVSFFVRSHSVKLMSVKTDMRLEMHWAEVNACGVRCSASVSGSDHRIQYWIW